MMSNRILASAGAAAAAALLLAASCVPRATVPIRAVSLEQRPSKSLVVLLPGRFDEAEDFARRRFPEIAREAGGTFDIVAVDAHLGYYRDGAIAERLEEDVIRPARARGYERIWLAGISMGGLGAIIYGDLHPGGVDGVFLIAPYLGPDDGAAVIAAAGGLAAWTPPPGPRDTLGFADRIWVGAKDMVGRPQPVVLAYGRDDKLAATHRVLAAALPPGRVLVLPGGHDWEPWQAAWRQFVEAGFVEQGGEAGFSGAAASAPAAGSAHPPSAPR
ncbi:MAG: lysophospholipase [Acidobacteria bacterium]|nr:lysophospholipase [Acidobacteriota bacterium]